MMTRDNSVGIATGYWLDDRGSSLDRYKVLSLFQVIQTGSGAHPASYPMGTGGSFLEVKRLEHEADHSPPASAEVKNIWTYTSIRLHGVVLN
jgi:hypothetical protein